VAKMKFDAVKLVHRKYEYIS